MLESTKTTKTKIIAHVEGGNDEWYSVYFNEDLPFGCFGEGRTIEEAKIDFLGTFDAFRQDHFQRTGENIEAEFEFVYDASAFLQHYKGILTLSGLSKITGINKVQLSQYVCGRRHPSQKTQQKIKASVISFAEELKHALA
ncbi:MAG: helix-turn-helix transcriptional regulator [Bacteroidales bacterium]|nr:helix-turn-helix transcriptional regulator [Bacteroidales bacterium]